MTCLIKGHTVLKSSAVLRNGLSDYRYRLTLDSDSRYIVHVESFDTVGYGSGEMVMYKGYSAARANHIFDYYSKA
jgi:hypothetical protein